MQSSASTVKTTHLRFAANAFTTSGARENVSVGVTVWIDKKRGAASTNEIDDESLKATVAQAEQLARISPVDREYMPTLGQQTYKPVNGYAEATSNISVTSRAKTINDVIAACEKAKVIGAGFHQARGSAGASATKNGNFIYERSSLVSLSTTARTPDGTSSGYFLRNHFDVAKLDTARVANEAIRKALESRNPRVLEPGVYPAILEPQAVADLLSFFAFSFDARSAEEGAVHFQRRAARRRSARRSLTSESTSTAIPGIRSCPVRSRRRRIPAQKIQLVRNGVLENLVYSRFWAKQKGKEPTPGPVNSIMESSQPPVSVEDMIKSTDRGILLGRFWYIRGARSAHRVANRTDARRHLVHRERQDSISGQELPLQSERDATARAGQCRDDRQAGTRRQLGRAGRQCRTATGTESEGVSLLVAVGSCLATDFHR